MKKILAIALAVLFVFATVGCGTQPAAAPEPTAQPAADAASQPEPQVPAIKTVVEGKLTVALSPDFSPMEFVDTTKSGQDQYVGFDVTLANYLADEMGLTLEIKPMSFDACQAAVQLGSVDMSISGFSWTAERAENFLLSDYYIAGENETEQAIITTKANEGAWTTVESFAGKKIGAQATSLQENLCKETFGDTITLELFKSIDDGILALQTGKIDAMAVAMGNGESIVAANPDGLAFTGYTFDVADESKNNVIMLNKASTEMLEKVNELLGKALEANMYAGWYADAQALAGIETAADVSYDDQGNVAG